MVKTHPYSKFVLKDLDGIRDSSDVILQIDKTESTYKNKGTEIYLCEVVAATLYNKSSTTERLTDEIIKVNAENRRLLTKITRLEREFAKLK